MTSKSIKVQFSQDDFSELCNTYGKLSTSVLPVPEKGHYIIKNDGIYQITQVFNISNYYDIYMSRTSNLCKHGDFICVENKDKFFKCNNNENGYYFNKITILTILDYLEQIKHKMKEIDDKIEDKIQISHNFN